MTSEAGPVPPTLLTQIVARLTLMGPATESVDLGMAFLLSPTLAVTADSPLLPAETTGTAVPALALHSPFWSPGAQVTAHVVMRDPTLRVAALALTAPAPVTLYEGLLAGIDRLADKPSWQAIALSSATPNGSPLRAEGFVEGIGDGPGEYRLRVYEGAGGATAFRGAPFMVGDAVGGMILGGAADAGVWTAVGQPALVDLVSAAMPILNTLSQSPTPPPDTEAPLDPTAFFARLAPRGRLALAHAEAIRTLLKQDVVHMEHLIAGLAASPGGPLATLMQQAGVDRERLWQALHSVRQGWPALPQPGEYPLLPLSRLPALSGHVQDALIGARNIADQRSAPIINSGHLLHGALSAEACSVATALRELKLLPTNIGLNQELVPGAWNGIAGFTPDDPNGPDLLGIGREVDALCKVIALKDVEPPLSLGLFGDWGTGKSFFMHKMEARIGELSNTPSRPGQPSPYCKQIVQLKFNAWHYSDTDLWANFAYAIFDGLADALAKQQMTPADGKQQDYQKALLLAEVVSAKEELAKKEQDRQQKEAELRENEDSIQRLKQSAGEAGAGLGAVAVEAMHLAARQPEVKDALESARQQFDNSIQTAANELGIKEEELRSGLLEWPVWWANLRAIQLELSTSRRRGRQLLSLGILALTLLVAVFVLPKVLGIHGLTTAVSALTFMVGLAGATAPFVPVAGRALGLMQQVLTSSQTLRNKVQEARLERENALQVEQQKIREQLVAARKAERQASDQLQQKQDQLEQLSANRQMADFIKQRRASSDYSKQFGSIARARIDFAQLNMLLEREARERARGSTPAEQAQPEPPLLPEIDRIILYIDDLDRCPETKVVDVLQAVHLLLAFPLFVVVVGVDPRWLLHSLRQHSKAFQDTSGEVSDISSDEQSHWQSTPLNYLEKIFQIPFTLRPMQSTGFDDLIDNLAAASESTADSPSPTAAGTDGSTKPPAPSVAPVGTPRPIDATPGANDSGAVQRATRLTTAPADQLASGGQAISPRQEPYPRPLRITDWERSYMKKLYPLIPSPRAAKRFVNVYRLFRAMVDEDKLDEFVGDELQGQYQAALLLLALIIGFPGEATEILAALMEPRVQGTWWDVVDRFKERGGPSPAPGATTPAPAEQRTPEAERWQELFAKLDAIKPVLGGAVQPLEDFVHCAPHAARYSFQSGRVLLV